MEKIVKRRIKVRDKVIKDAKSFVRCVSKIIKIKNAILFGSYARGDFNAWSDVDILIVADDEIPSNPIHRLEMIMRCIQKYPFIEPIIVNSIEYSRLKKKKNPIIQECEKYGIELI